MGRRGRPAMRACSSPTCWVGCCGPPAAWPVARRGMAVLRPLPAARPGRRRAVAAGRRPGGGAVGARPYRDALRAAVLAGKLDDQPAALTELGRRASAAPWPRRGRRRPGDLRGRRPGRRPAQGPRRADRRRRRRRPRPPHGRPARPRPAAATSAVPAAPPVTWPAPVAAPVPTAGPRPAHHQRRGTAWPAAGSCWSTTWPPPAAPSPAPPPPSATPAPTTSKPPSSPPPQPPCGRPQRPGGLCSRVAPAPRSPPIPAPRPARPRRVAPAWRRGLLGRGVVRWSYDRDLPCSRRSHCVVVTRFRV